MSESEQPDADPQAVRPLIAIARAVTNRPVPTRAVISGLPGAVLGSLDQAETDGTLVGWCWSPARPREHQIVAILIDGREVDRVLCDGVRDDLREAGIGDGDHGFLMCLDETAMTGGQTVSVAVRDVATGQALGTPRDVTWRRLPKPPRPDSWIPTPLDGTLDRVTRDGWVSGWTRDPHDPDARVDLDIMVDDDVVGTTVAAGFRADLQAAGIGDGAHGFSFALPYEVMAERGTITVQVRERRTDRVARILGEPVVLRIGRLAAAEQRVQDLERQVRLLRGQLDALTRDAVERPHADQRAAQALFGTVAGFFRELADGAAPDARSFGAASGASGGLRGAIDDVTARLAPIVLRRCERPLATICVPATAPVELVHRCLLALHEAGVDAQADVLVIEPPAADPRIALLPMVVRGLQFAHIPPGQGLVAGCNEAARAGRGDLVAFVSPDILPSAGWLSELAATFAREPAAVVVGGAVTRADGLLQHSGFAFAPGGLLRDPGQFAEADRPEYCHLRAVDAVAGLALGIDRRRFNAVGGFAASFNTLTGAVVDFCARVRSGGHGTVMVQPVASAQWADTADTDPNRTVPDLARPDEESRRLRIALLSLPDSVPARQPRALVVDDQIPRPERDAGSITTMEQLRLLRSLGWHVTFAPASGGVVSAGARRRLEREGIEVAVPPHSPSLTHTLRERGGELDLVQVYRYGNAALLNERVREFAPQARLVFAPADLHFLREGREAALTRRGKGAAEATRAEELACVRAADATLLNSDHERALLRAEPSIDPGRLHLLRWIARPITEVPPFDARDGIAFVANFGHPPNLDAMTWFCAKIMPRLRAIRPGIVLHIVGADPPASIVALAAPDILVRGWVANLDGLLGQVRLTIAPLRYGAGFKGKVATSLAHGVPAVVTTSAAEGMGLADGDGLIVRDDAASFAKAVATLHDTASAWATLSARALDRVRTLYSPEAARDIYRGMLDSLGLHARPPAG